MLKHITYPLLMVFVLSTCPPSFARNESSKQLNWQLNPNESCGGHFVERKPSNRLGTQSLIRADQTAIALANGTSGLHGHVLIRQGNKKIVADDVQYTLNSQQELTQLTLHGHIRIQEGDRLLTATSAKINLQTHRAAIQQSFYRFAHRYIGQRFHQRHVPSGLSGWGYAESMRQSDRDHYQLRDVTYSTCSPEQTTWQLNAQQIELDHVRGRGYAHNLTLRWLDWPIFRLPYLSFPISPGSQSGFLTPSVGYQNRHGFRLSQPFYLRLKPNVDLTLYPQYFSKRGVGFGTELRYLQHGYNGFVYFNIIPNDRRYDRLQTESPGLSTQATRMALHWSHHLTNPNGLSGHINLNLVSDNAYLTDFGHSYLSSQVWQLTRDATARYDSRFFHAEFLLQRYQQLHLPQNALLSGIYSQLPSVRFQWEMPQSNVDVAIRGQYSHFYWPQPNTAHPDGERFWLQPTVRWPLAIGVMTMTPELSVYSRYYRLHHSVGFARHVSQVIPSSRFTVIANLSSHHPSVDSYHQLRAYFLWTPYREQASIPLFDTAYSPYGFEQLFQDNRFGGYDRIGDTKQVNLSIVNTYYAPSNPQAFIRFGVGTRLYFAKPKVTLCAGDCQNLATSTDVYETFADPAPLLGQATIYWGPRLNSQVDIAYNTQQSEFENAGVRIHAQPNHRIWELSYNYQRHLIRLNENAQYFTEPAHQVGLSTAFKLSNHWHLLGSWSYNIGHRYVQTYYLGTTYDSCCWALTMAAGKSLTSVSQTRRPSYNSGVYFQLSLKGLATLSHHNPNALFARIIPGFEIIQRGMK